MKISANWLRRYANFSGPDAELERLLNSAGLEIDGAETLPACTGVVVGEIRAVEPHPDAERLRVCSVAGTGPELQQVVCGAANARVGLKVPFAQVGAQLPGMTIKAARLRGVESAGMLCAQTELGLGEGSEGLWELPADAPVGAPLADYLGLPDRLLEVDLTPNRADCLSAFGLAREISALAETELGLPPVRPAAVAGERVLPVRVLAPECCPRYAGRVIENVDPSRPTPLWILERLRRAGLRSVDVIVDITNYVLLEMGQPLHAFDLARIHSEIQVRLAASDESLELLDGRTINLTSDCTVIADADGPIALAGVMGGARTAVGADTHSVFLESAFFAPLALAGRARHFGLHTDASHRFERGVDFELPVPAIERATELLLEFAGGRAGPLVVVETLSQLPARPPIALRESRLREVLGAPLTAAEARAILLRLGLVEVTDGNYRAPSYRFDLAIEEDLIEEVARVYGYERLPIATLSGNLALPTRPDNARTANFLKQQLAARGFQEVITYSFVPADLQQKLYGSAGIAVVNPISAELSCMRLGLAPGLLTTVQNNLKRQQARVQIFETGLCFEPGEQGQGYRQWPRLGGVMVGEVPKAWDKPAHSYDFFDLKGEVTALLPVGTEFVVAELPGFIHPGQGLAIARDGRHCGYLGTLHPELARELDLPRGVMLFECDLAALLEQPLPRHQPVSKFPAVTRDLAILVAGATPFSAVAATVRAAAGADLKHLELFDEYRGDRVPAGTKSLAFSLSFQKVAATLTDSEVNARMEAITDALAQQLSARLR